MTLEARVKNEELSSCIIDTSLPKNRLRLHLRFQPHLILVGDLIHMSPARIKVIVDSNPIYFKLSAIKHVLVAVHLPDTTKSDQRIQ